MGKCWPIFNRFQAFKFHFRLQSTFGYSASRTSVSKSSSNSYSVFHINSNGAIDLQIRGQVGQYDGTDVRRVIFCSCSTVLFFCEWCDSAINSPGEELSIALSFRSQKNNRAEIGGLRSPQMAMCLIWVYAVQFSTVFKPLKTIFKYQPYLAIQLVVLSYQKHWRIVIQRSRSLAWVQ